MFENIVKHNNNVIAIDYNEKKVKIYNERENYDKLIENGNKKEFLLNDVENNKHNIDSLNKKVKNTKRFLKWIVIPVNIIGAALYLPYFAPSFLFNAIVVADFGAVAFSIAHIKHNNGIVKNLKLINEINKEYIDEINNETVEVEEKQQLEVPVQKTIDKTKEIQKLRLFYKKNREYLEHCYIDDELDEKLKSYGFTNEEANKEFQNYIHDDIVRKLELKRR